MVEEGSSGIDAVGAIGSADVGSSDDLSTTASWRATQRQPATKDLQDAVAKVKTQLSSDSRCGYRPYGRDRQGLAVGQGPTAVPGYGQPASCRHARELGRRQERPPRPDRVIRLAYAARPKVACGAFGGHHPFSAPYAGRAKKRGFCRLILSSRTSWHSGRAGSSRCALRHRAAARNSARTVTSAPGAAS
jgi:hypothetical protein